MFVFDAGKLINNVFELLQDKKRAAKMKTIKRTLKNIIAVLHKR